MSKRVEVIVVEEGVSTELGTPQGRRPLGLLRGQSVVPEDFNEPLPSEIQDYFEGEPKKS